MTRLLIVDDSSVVRNLLEQLFADEGGFQVELAKDGLEALEKNRSFLPEVVLLDINMPGLDGIAALSRMMAERPVPVVMLSSLTERGAFATREALNLVAVDCLAKPDGIQCKGLDGIRAELLAKVRAAKDAMPGRSAPAPAPGDS